MSSGNWLIWMIPLQEPGRTMVYDLGLTDVFSLVLVSSSKVLPFFNFFLVVVFSSMVCFPNLISSDPRMQQFY